MRKAERIEGAQMRKTAPTPEIPPQVSLGQAIVSRLPAGLQTVERDHNSKGWWHVSFNVPNWGSPSVTHSVARTWEPNSLRVCLRTRVEF